MEVRTIRPKPPKDGEAAGGSDSGMLAGAADASQARYKKTSNDPAVGTTTPVEVGYLPARVTEGTFVDGFELPTDDEIVWAEMSPDAEVTLGKDFVERPKQRGPWYRSFRLARRESMRTGKPLLIWFTRTASPASPMCVRLRQEVFAAHDFGKWADEHLIRLKVDASGGELDPNEFGQISSSQVEKRKYAKKLKEQFHVMGHPTLVVVQPDGAVYSQERGYRRGDKKELWGKLKNAVMTIEHNHEIWERKMAAKGYRRWKGKNGQEVFAKLLRYREPYLLLAEPDGNKIKTSQKDLSKEDRGWIVAELEKRGL
jgi:hypothetical protein